MPDLELAFNIGIPALLLVVGYLTGTFIERRHFRNLMRREEAAREVLAFAIRHIPDDLDLADPELVTGNAVISVDYFKSFAAMLRLLLGGRIGAYESLYERARREAMVRMKENARHSGRNLILNVKLESARIYAGGRNATVSVEAMAFGTAYRDDHAQPAIQQP